VTRSSAFGDYRAALQRDLQSGLATEHTDRPALKTLIEKMGGVRATNERLAVERSEQMERSCPRSTTILTDYGEFRWYVDGVCRRAARLATLERPVP
jgi:hypothetical protein